MQITQLQQFFDLAEAVLANEPTNIWLVCFVVPVALALFSKRLLVFLGSLLMVGLALLAILSPSSINLFVVTGAYVGGLLVAISGIQNRRRELSHSRRTSELTIQFERIENCGGTSLPRRTQNTWRDDWQQRLIVLVVSDTLAS